MINVSRRAAAPDRSARPVVVNNPGAIGRGSGTAADRMESSAAASSRARAKRRAPPVEMRHLVERAPARRTEAVGWDADGHQHHGLDRRWQGEACAQVGVEGAVEVGT